MQAEIIAIGDELTSGARLDTNSQWLSQQLTDLGVRVIAHTTIADDLPAMVDAIHCAANRCDIAICSGGLGPTADDLTRQGFANAAKVELVLDDDALQHIRQLFARRKREMPERNIVQAQFPAGSKVISNPHGSAPGFEQVVEVSDQSARFFTLPGVPAELKEMFAETVKPRIIDLLGGKRKWIRHRSIKCFGVGESDIEAMLPDIIRRGREPTVGITVSQATITLRISAEGDSVHACQSQIDSTETTIRGCLGDLVFGTEEEQLEHAVIRILKETGKTICVAEIGTGGLLSKWFSLADQNQEVFRGGQILTTAPNSLEEIADRVRRELLADFCLVTGPFPTLDSHEATRDHVAFLIAGDENSVVQTKPFLGHPDILHNRAAKQALDFLRKSICKQTE